MNFLFGAVFISDLNIYMSKPALYVFLGKHFVEIKTISPMFIKSVLLVFSGCKYYGFIRKATRKKFYSLSHVSLQPPFFYLQTMDLIFRVKYDTTLLTPRRSPYIDSLNYTKHIVPYQPLVNVLQIIS